MMKQLLAVNDISLTQVFIAIAVSCILTICISWVYRITTEEINYSQSFVHTLVMVGVVTTVIIIVIGTNIARAFSLAGALSIIRFRSAIRDPKDVAYIFFSMATGLVCGAGQYLYAILFVLVLDLVMYLLYKVGYAKTSELYRTLKIKVPENISYEEIYGELLEKYTDMHKLESTKLSDFGTTFELIYIIKMKKGKLEKNLMDDIRVTNNNMNIKISKYVG